MSKIQEAICFHTENGHIMFVIDKLGFSIQVNGKQIASLPREDAEHAYAWLDKTLYGPVAGTVPNEYLDNGSQQN